MIIISYFYFDWIRLMWHCDYNKIRSSNTQLLPPAEKFDGIIVDRPNGLHCTSQRQNMVWRKTLKKVVVFQLDFLTDDDKTLSTKDTWR